MKKYVLSLDDVNSNYFHFTLKNNLASIEKNGLLPKKGKHSRHIEETKKIFFVKGLDNLLILFDCWINVYKKVPLLPDSKITYGLGSKLMRSKFFPMILVDLYFEITKKSVLHKKRSYKVFDKLLDDCILLKLNIKEGLEFDLFDCDEIKTRGYRKRHLVELGYSKKYSDINSNKMDEWNLHTKNNVKIDTKKIEKCFINNSSNLRDIIDYALINTKLDLEDICPNLLDYLKICKKI